MLADWQALELGVMQFIECQLIPFLLPFLKRSGLIAVDQREKQSWDLVKYFQSFTLVTSCQKRST
ncbi:hypothetical protein ACFIO0_07010 [Pseudosulfitobacter sp. SM2401]